MIYGNALKELQGIFTTLGLKHKPTLDTHVIHADWLTDEVRRFELQAHLNESDIVAVSFPGETRLPKHWKSLFTEAMKKSRGPLVLVAFLQEGPVAQENERFFYGLAKSRRLEFISYLPPGETETQLPPKRLEQRKTLQLSASQPAPWPWDHNE